MKQVIMAVICLISILSYSQTGYKYNVETLNDTPSIVVKVDDRFHSLLNQYNSIDKKANSIDGYRIQIVSSNDRANVLKLKSEFYRRFKDTESYVHYQQPNFKLRVGNFRNKLEAQRMLLEVNKYYPDAFLVKENIPLIELQPKEE